MKRTSIKMEMKMLHLNGFENMVGIEEYASIPTVLSKKICNRDVRRCIKEV